MKQIIYDYCDGAWSEAFDSSLDGENTLVLLFGVSDFEVIKTPLEALKSAYPKSIFMGSSSAGVIVEDEISEGVLSVMVIAFEKTKIALLCEEVKKSEDSFETGKKLASSFEKEGLKSLFILSDGLNVNGTKLSEGLSSVLGNNIVVTGGLAGDDERFEQTWVLVDKNPKEKFVSALAFYGDCIHVTYGSGGGWQAIGPKRVITKSKNNTLYEIDGKPALKIYKEYLGERSKWLPASGLLFPIKLINEDDESKIRTVLAVDEESQSITFAGELPEGSTISLMTSNFANLIEGASNAAKVLDLDAFKDVQQVASIAISCVGRKLVMKQRTESELEVIKDILGTQTKQIGFYSYGEISPLASGKCDLHNQTMTLTVFWES